MVKKYRLYLYRRQQRQEKNLLRNDMRRNVVGIRTPDGRSHRGTCLHAQAGNASIETNEHHHGSTTSVVATFNPPPNGTSPEVSESDQCQSHRGNLHRVPSIQSNGLTAGDNTCGLASQNGEVRSNFQFSLGEGQHLE